MTALNKQALRQSAEKAQEHGVFNMDIHSETVLALLGELEAANSLNKHLELAIRKAEGCSEALRRKTEAAEKRIAEQQSSIIAPGIMRCAGCGFVLTKNSVNLAAGTITAGDSKTEPCPNGCGPLWPVTWKEHALQMRDDSEKWFEELQEANRRIAELEARTVAVKQFDDFQIVHYGGSEDYAKGYIDCQNNYNKALTGAGIGVKGE